MKKGYVRLRKRWRAQIWLAPALPQFRAARQSTREGTTRFGSRLSLSRALKRRSAGRRHSIRLSTSRAGCAEKARSAWQSSSMPHPKSWTRVAILNPVHLFEQADRLISPLAGRPRQADMRRAISAAYYAIFHAIVTAATDEFVGVTNRDESRYGLVHRSVDHAWLRRLCEEVQKTTPSSKFRCYTPPAGFGANIVALAATVEELQEKRHAAD